MSRTKPTSTPNPAELFIKYLAEEGRWTYYDKDQEKDIDLQPPIYFVMLDQLTTIKGWSDPNESYIYSNEVHNQNELLRVKTFKGNLNIVGYYQDIKDEVKAAGGRYCKSVYAMVFDESRENFKLVNFQLMGIAFKSFLEAKPKYSNVICITGEGENGKKGKSEFIIPKYKTYKIDDDLSSRADEMDKELQEYFDFYKSNQIKEQVEQSETLDHSLSQEVSNKADRIVNKIEEQRLNQMADNFEEETDESLPF